MQEVPQGYVRIIPAQVVFDMHDRYGMPFDVTMESLRRKRMLCDLGELLRICVARGWNEERAREQIRAAFVDAYGMREEFQEWCVKKEET